MFNKIGLGTAQWGMDYGINNISGKTNLENIYRIIDYASAKGIQTEIIKLNGSMELAPSLNMCKRIVDLVSTGKTLKVNGLVEIDEIMKIQSKLIINRSAYKTDMVKIKKIISEFENIVS